MSTIKQHLINSIIHLTDNDYTIEELEKYTKNELIIELIDIAYFYKTT